MAIGNTSLLLVGCGKMGGALLARVLSARLASKIYVVDPSPPSAEAKNSPLVSWIASRDKIDPAFVPDIILLAIKPEDAGNVLPTYAGFKNCVFVSILTGTKLERLQSLLGGGGKAVVRVVPNLPASIGKGVSVAVANANVDSAQRALADAFLKTVGETAWVEDENLMDTVTALSGSGPAYVFALCEAMTKAGGALGLPPGLAAMLARQTVIGSGALLDQSSATAEALRHAVTSPGGTTEAALKQLLGTPGLHDLLQKAMTSAAERAKELAK